MKWVEMLELAKTDPVKLLKYAKDAQQTFSTGFQVGVMVSGNGHSGRLPKSLNLGYWSTQQDMAYNALDKTPGAWAKIRESIKAKE